MKHKHGGKRKGAGAKKKPYTTKRIWLKVPTEIHSKLCNYCKVEREQWVTKFNKQHGK